ncbi:MAG: carbohydrate ABC transporter permease [Pleomorphochaeta sp.]
MKRKHINKLILYIFLSIVAILEITPLLVALLNSLRTNADIKRVAIGFPTTFQFENYINAWKIGNYGIAFLNSIIISLVTCAVVLICAIISGYFLSRIRNKFSKFLNVYYGVALSISIFSYMIPLYYSFSKLNMINSRITVILIYIAINLPFNIILANTFITGIPKTLDEAAIIDGCSTYQLIWKIITPLAKPIITTIILIVFVTTWNEFTVANTFLQLPEAKTAATRYVLFSGQRGSDLSLIYSAGIITMLPIVLIFILLQNYFIEGMTSGSIK